MQNNSSKLAKHAENRSYIRRAYDYAVDNLCFLHIKKYGVAKRLLLSILLFSSLVTLIATGIQFYLDFQRDVNAIERRLDEVETSYLKSIQASLWNMDIRQLELQLEGIMRLPDMRAVYLVEVDTSIDQPLTLSYGERSSRSTIIRTYPLIHLMDDQTERQLGTLNIEANLEEIYDRLFQRGLYILFSQGIKTFLVSLFILLFIHRLVTRHLEHISDFVGNINLVDNTPLLSLNRPKQHISDELENVVRAFNTMRVRLSTAYSELYNVNTELTEDIAARQYAEREIKRLNEELEQRVTQRTSELEAANNELSSFCYSVSHDLRAPLRRIDGFRRMLIASYGDNIDDKSAHYFQRIEVGTQEMSDMIDSFLTLSRSTNTTLTLESIDLSGLVTQAIQRLQEKDPKRISNVIIQQGLCAEGDRRLLDILLANLIENAWKYTQHKDQSHIEFGVDSGQKSTVYFVRDNGAGFNMELAEHLLKPFTRLHTNDEYEGIGIGLATVQRIVARHGGRIWFDAKTDFGATFYFTLWENGKD